MHFFRVIPHWQSYHTSCLNIYEQEKIGTKFGNGDPTPKILSTVSEKKTTQSRSI